MHTETDDFSNLYREPSVTLLENRRQSIFSLITQAIKIKYNCQWYKTDQYN